MLTHFTCVALVAILVIFLGWCFAYRINALLGGIDRIRHWLLPPVLMGLAVIVVVCMVRRRRRVQTEPTA